MTDDSTAGERQPREPEADLQSWLDQLGVLISFVAEVEATSPMDLSEQAADSWSTRLAPASAPPPDGAAMLLIVETLTILMQTTSAVAIDYEYTPDYRDRVTVESTRCDLLKKLRAVQSDAKGWTLSGLPSMKVIKDRMSAVKASILDTQESGERMMKERRLSEEAAEADPYGAVLGYIDPDIDAAIIYTKVCSFTEEEDKRYRSAYNRLRKLIDSELLQHIRDEGERFIESLEQILIDSREGRFSVTNLDSFDERRRKVRSALISLASALHSHRDQSIRAVREQFGRKSTQETQVLNLFQSALDSSFDYGWLIKLRDILLHGDINAFSGTFTASLHEEDVVDIRLDREYALRFTKEYRKNEKWLKRSELAAMAENPSIVEMTSNIQPLLSDLQEALDKILYPNTAEDAATVRELIGRFDGRVGLYALQSGPGFTRRAGVPPCMNLAPRVLTFAANYEVDPGEVGESVGDSFVE